MAAVAPVGATASLLVVHRSESDPGPATRAQERKALTPNDFGDLAAVARTLNEFEHPGTRSPSHSTETSPATIFAELMVRLADHEPHLRLAA